MAVPRSTHHVEVKVNIFSLLAIIAISAFSIQDAAAKTINVSTKLAPTLIPVAEDNPPCETGTVENTKKLAERLKDMGSSVVGKATAALKMGGDPFNERRAHNSVCRDLCVTTPIGAQLTVEGSITPIDWRGPLSGDLPATVNPGNYAAISGPAIEQSANLQVVCFTAKNWSHNQERTVGIKVTYDE